MTHIINNPHYEIARATAELVDGRTSSKFLWFEEPGTFAIDLVRPDRSPTVEGTCRVFAEVYSGGVPEQATPVREIAFTTHLTYWGALVTTSLSRSKVLSEHTLYSSWNEVEISGRELAEFEAYLHRQRGIRGR